MSCPPAHEPTVAPALDAAYARMRAGGGLGTPEEIDACRAEIGLPPLTQAQHEATARAFVAAARERLLAEWGRYEARRERALFERFREGGTFEEFQRVVAEAE